jgi:ATP-dependent DNA ligase
MMCDGLRDLHYIGEEGTRIFETLQKIGLEGTVAKRAESTYQRGRSWDRIKVKTEAGRATDAERAK